MLAEDVLPSRCRHGLAHIPTDDDDADDLDAKNAEAVIQFMYLETCGWLSYPFFVSVPACDRKQQIFYQIWPHTEFTFEV